VIVAFLSSFLLSFLIGFFVVSLLWRRGRQTNSDIILRCCLAVGFGFGMSSCLFFCWLYFLGSTSRYFGRTYIVSEVVTAAGLGAAYFYSPRRPSLSNGEDYDRREEYDSLLDRLLPAVFYVVLSGSVITFILIAFTHQHGEWDAWSIWNLRARFLARGTEHWRNAFVLSQGLPHADYPLLLPLTIARGWKYIGSEAFLVPIAVAFLFTFSSVGILCSSLAILRSKRTCYLAGTVMLGASSLASHGASQYADVVIGFFMLCAIVAVAMRHQMPGGENAGFLVMAGLAVGFAAWTKNEGLLFLVVFAGVFFLEAAWRSGWKACLREASMLAIGLLPVLAVVAWFKLSLAPLNYLQPGNYSAQGPMQYFLEPGSVSQKLTTLFRYSVVTKAMARELLFSHAKIPGVTPLLVLYALFARPRKSSVISACTGAAILVLMLVGYFFVYITTPLNLVHHLDTSLGRLLLQLWPSWLFVFFLATSTPKPNHLAVAPHAQ
jgi:hypothetical protein